MLLSTHLIVLFIHAAQVNILLANDAPDCFNCSTSTWNLSKISSTAATTRDSCNSTQVSSNLTNNTQRSATGMNAWTSVQFSILPILLLLIACIGLVGNALNFLVLYSYHTTQIACGGECTARVNLLGLALADFLVCLAALPLGYVQRRHQYLSFMLFYTIIGPGLVTYFLSVSVWMVLLMSVVRYMAVCRPLTSRTWLTSRHMCRVIVVIYVVALIFHIPSFLMFTYEEESALQKKQVAKCLPVNKTTMVVSTESTTMVNRSEECDSTFAILVFERSFWRSEAIYIGYHVIHIILTNIGPFIGVLVSNIAVIRACRRSDACRRSFVGSTMPNRDTAGLSGLVDNSPQRILFKTHPTTSQNRNVSTRDLQFPQTGVFLFNTPSITSYRLSLQRYPNSATNRVTPLLLAVIIAFLLFTAPFGIVHFVCLQLMRNLGVRVRDNQEARQLYTALNLTVEWTNVIQLLGCALNFFLYFLVSTIFRRTTKRTFQRIYKQMRGCRRDLIKTLFLGKHSKSMDSWEQDTRTNELRRELEYKVAPAPFTPSSARSRCFSSNSSRGNRTFRSQSSANGRLVNLLSRGNSRSVPSTRFFTSYPIENKIHSSPLPDLHYIRNTHSYYEPFLHHRQSATCDTNIACPPSCFPTNHTSRLTYCAQCNHSKLFHRSLPLASSSCLVPPPQVAWYTSTRSEPQCCAQHCTANSFFPDYRHQTCKPDQTTQPVASNLQPTERTATDFDTFVPDTDQREVQSTEM